MTNEPDSAAAMDSWTAKIMRVASILKARFQNLSVEETVELSARILKAVDK